MNPRTKPAKTGITAALQGLTRERIDLGHKNEDRIIEVLGRCPEEKKPPWFLGIRRATEREDLHGGIDFFVHVRFAETETFRGNAPPTYWVPVNAKSSGDGLVHLAASRRSRKRRQNGHVPIVAYIVDRTKNDEDLLGNFLAIFPARKPLRSWLRAENRTLAK